MPEDVSLRAVAWGRLMVRKTYKLFIGGAFPRSESGRSYPICGSEGRSWPTRPSPPARTSGRPSWRPQGPARLGQGDRLPAGQVVYRVAEMLEGRHAQFVDALVAGEGLDAGAASSTVDAAVDRWSGTRLVGQVRQVAGSSNP